MPIYEYQCQSCGHRAEEFQRMDAPPLTTCSVCGGPYKKLISAPAFQFKGSGWYVTDYARKGKDKEAKAGKEEGGEGKGEKNEETAEKGEKGEKKDEKGEKKDEKAAGSSGEGKGKSAAS